MSNELEYNFFLRRKTDFFFVFVFHFIPFDSDFSMDFVDWI